MHAPGIWGIIIVAVVVILLFEVASGIKSFQKGMRDEEQKPAAQPAAQIDASTTVEPARETEKAKDA